MGQSVQIVQKRTLRTNVVRFEIDRSLTSTAHEIYRDPSEITGNRPTDILADRLFAVGDVVTIHIFSNLITVTTASAASNHDQNTKNLEEALRSLFIHYRPGVMPTAV